MNGAASDVSRMRVDHLSGGGLPSEELVIQRAVGGVELGLQEDAAVGDGF